MTAPRPLQTRRARVALGVALAWVGGLGFLPLFEGPGYELSLGVGLVLPSVAAVWAALDQHARPLEPLGALSRGVSRGVMLGGVALVAAVAHGLRAGFCDLPGGVELMLLGPLLGVVLGGVWGSLAGTLADASPRRAIGAAIAGPLGTALFQVSLFYATPMVFAYDPFVGHFSGALYDTQLDSDGLWTYRTATLATLYACYVAALHLRRGGRHKLRPVSIGRPGLALTGTLAALGSVWSVAQGSELGHWNTAATIRAELGGRTVVGRCELIHDAGLSRERALRQARDCDAHIAAIGAWLGSRDTRPVTAFLFPNAGAKRAGMGAAHTSIAKPWRREVYLHSPRYPHPVMAHELAHVLAGEMGRGPFRIAGGLGGIWPNPGLIEGIAVAAAPRDEALSATDWAAAMKRIGKLPPLERVFGMGFFGGHASTSYTAAGAFVGFVRAHHGPEAVARWYGGATLPEVTGKSLAALEQAWHAELDAVVLSEPALAHARARFDRAGVFQRRCPHEVDEAVARADRLRGRGVYDAAIRAYDAALALDPSRFHARLSRAQCQERSGDVKGARGALEALAKGDGRGRGARRQAHERLGDMALRQGDAARARASYAEASKLSTDEGRLRTLAIKGHYADAPEAREALLALLVGTQRRGPSTAEALDRIGRWRALPGADGTPDYLFARQYFGTRDYEAASERLDRALERGLPLDAVLRETLRLRTIAACALQDGATARRALARYRGAPGVVAPRVATLSRLVARCSGGAAAGRPAP